EAGVYRLTICGSFTAQTSADTLIVALRRVPNGGTVANIEGGAVTLTALTGLLTQYLSKTVVAKCNPSDTLEVWIIGSASDTWAPTDLSLFVERIG
ncbi:hypothetical protein LCGC14_2920130, partial [marine sediment metagenome]